MSLKAQGAVAEAKKLIGTRFLLGGTSPEGFDSPGLVYYCYKQVGVKLPKLISKLINMRNTVSQSDLKIGDLVFIKTDEVGIYIGAHRIIYASKNGVRESSITSFYTAKRVE